MKKNLLNKLAVSAFAAAALAGMGGMTMTAHAEVYRTWIQRGDPSWSSVTTKFEWNVDNRLYLAESTAYQLPEGFFATAFGCNRTYTGGMEHDWVSVVGTSANIGFGACSFPIQFQYRDKVALFNLGGSRVDWNAG